MSVETTRVERFIFERLNAIPAITGVVANRFYAEATPDDAALPCVKYDLRSAHSVMGVGPARIMVDTQYVVRGIFASDSFIGQPEDVADEIDAALHGARGSVAGGQVLFCVREDPFSMVETPGGQQIRHLGGIYRFWIQGE